METNDRPPNAGRNRSASTLVEVLITCTLITMMGTLVFMSLSAGVRLFGRNVAINVPYQSSRVAFDLLNRDLHSAVGEPALIDDSLAEVSGAGPAAGVALRLFAGGPCVVAADAAAGANTVEIRQSGTFTPQAGDRLSLPAFRVERNITSVTNGASTCLLTLDGPLGAALVGTASLDFVAFFTRRIGYAVVGAELLRFPNLSQPTNARVITRGVTNATPFSFPLASGLPDRRFVQAALTARESGSTARLWGGIDANLNFTAAPRAMTPLTAP